jgi:hypothetical protein
MLLSQPWRNASARQEPRPPIEFALRLVAAKGRSKTRSKSFMIANLCIWCPLNQRISGREFTICLS